MVRHERPLTHDWIWGAIDTLARRQGLSSSALARLAGLDPTAFNRSKRFTAEGRPRWPSTESIAKVLEATGTSLDEFASIELADALEISFDETDEGPMAGLPVVGVIRDAAISDWEPLTSQVTGTGDAQAVPAGRRRFALAVADGSLEPVYSSGNTLVVSEAAEPRPGDRVLVKPAGMLVLPRLLVSATPSRFEFGPLAGHGERITLSRRRIDWIARIVLVRQ